MEYTYDVPVIKDTYVKTYLAQIKGSHDTYFFDRRFLRYNKTQIGCEYHYSYDIGGHGVFEQSVKRYTISTNEEIDVKKQWFVYYHKKIIPIVKCDVLPILEMMNAYYSEVRAMGDQLKMNMMKLAFIPQYDM